jgi:hypothetical protein
LKNKKEKQPLLQIQGQSREVAEPSRRPDSSLSIHQLVDSKLSLSSREYCIRFALEKEFDQLKKTRARFVHAVQSPARRGVEGLDETHEQSRDREIRGRRKSRF